ncbi:hypothetical protein JCM10296v2_005294 [Rhodotorula toruloides]
MAAPPSHSVADLEQHFADTVFPADYTHDLQLRLTGSSLLRLVGSSKYIEVAKSLVFRIYAFLDGARSSGILDPYKAWIIDVKEMGSCVAHVAFLNGQSHTMADPRHWGNVAYQGLFVHLSAAPNGSQSWALHGQKGTAFEAQTDPTRLFEEGSESLHCSFEEHPFAVQGRS